MSCRLQVRFHKGCEFSQPLRNFAWLQIFIGPANFRWVQNSAPLILNPATLRFLQIFIPRLFNSCTPPLLFPNLLNLNLVPIYGHKIAPGPSPSLTSLYIALPCAFEFISHLLLRRKSFGAKPFPSPYPLHLSPNQPMVKTRG